MNSKGFLQATFDSDQSVGAIFRATEFLSLLTQVNVRVRGSCRDLASPKREDSMPKRNSRPKGIRADGRDELLECRMDMLGLEAIEAGGAFDEIRRYCRSCGYREACAVDMERDPNNPVWETYCPNAGRFIALAEESWLSK
jgi:hypothetical protein